MLEPCSFVDSTNLSYVCMLKKAIYGLKQAPWALYITLKTFLL